MVVLRRQMNMVTKEMSMREGREGREEREGRGGEGGNELLRPQNYQLLLSRVIHHGCFTFYFLS